MRRKKQIYKILVWILSIVIIVPLCNVEGFFGYIENYVKADSSYNLPDDYPATGQRYWVVFREGSRNDRIEMSTCDIVGNAENAWIEWDKGLYLRDGKSESGYNQYCLDGDTWIQIGTYHLFSDHATSVIASNLDIYNASGELVLAKANNPYGSSGVSEAITRIENNGHIYQRYDKEMDWYDAKEYCRSLGGHLVTITSYDEQKIVEKLLTSNYYESYWMGAQVNNNQWSWITGEVFGYTNWAEGEPNDQEDGMCLQIYTRSSARHKTGTKGEWDDTWHDGDHADGITEQGFICEWDSVVIGKTYQVGHAVYKVTGTNSVKFVGFKGVLVSSVTIPNTVILNGNVFRVTSIATGALKGRKKLKTVVIGKNVETIGEKAFYGCKALEKISLKSIKLKKIGKNALKGIHAKATIKVPKAKLKAYTKLLKKGQGKQVKIKE